AIQEHLFALPFWAGQSPVLFFSTMKTEVETHPMIEKAMAQGRLVALPKMAPHGTLELKIVRNLETDLEPNRLGIWEPKDACPPMEKTDLGLILVPGVAFDPMGYRIGYGGGYYDRLLVSVPKAQRVAVAFDLQKVRFLPRKSHDVPVDVLVTETGHSVFYRPLLPDPSERPGGGFSPRI
ncbi:MAG: 5-formyltetrahydrofolate cyclo-ligase, partial [Planctomycetota bacterium]